MTNLCIHGEIPDKCDVCGEPPRVCKHGQLARSCNVCELEQEIDALRAERDALSADRYELAQLVEAVISAWSTEMMYLLGHAWVSRAVAIQRREMPEQKE
jgi:hypothetical protein